MNDHDEYLWSGQGTVAPEIAALEHELRPLAWRPRELSLVDAAPAAEAAPTELIGLRKRPDAARRRGAREWLPLVAGLAAAAVVLVVLASLRGRYESPAPNDDPPAQPTGAPELRDPFSGDAPELPTPSTIVPELKDPFANDLPSAPHRANDLKDPFAATLEQDEQPEQAPPLPPRPRKRTTSPDLKDPFYKDDQSAPRKPGKLYDPFAGKQREPQQSSPDLMDPFRR